MTVNGLLGMAMEFGGVRKGLGLGIWMPSTGWAGLTAGVAGPTT